MFSLITTKQYKLRPFQKSDARLWQIWDIDNEVQTHLPEPKNTQQKISHQYRYIKECQSDKNGYYWSIETLDGTTIGTSALLDIDWYHKTSNINIVIGDKKYWGQGVAQEVITAIINYAFKDLRLIRVSAEVEANNMAMINVFKKTGFKSDGLFEKARLKNHKRIDVLHFGILK